QAAVPTRVAGYLSSVVAEANNAATLIDDLVLVNQIERGEVNLRPTEIDLGQMLRQVATSHLPEGYAARLAVDAPKERIAAYGDPEATRRAIVSLLHVAVRFCRTEQSCYARAHRAPSEGVVY